MKFSKGFLQDEGGETVYDRIIGHGRWNVHHERVFAFEARYYITQYSVGATENQDEEPYQDDADEIECVEVFPRERVVTIYESKAADAVDPHADSTGPPSTRV